MVVVVAVGCPNTDRDSMRTKNCVCVLACVDCDCIGNCVVDCDCVVDCVRVRPAPSGSGERPKVGVRAGGNSKIQRGCGCASWAVVKRAAERTMMMCGSNDGGGFDGAAGFDFDCGCAGDASVSIS